MFRSYSVGVLAITFILVGCYKEDKAVKVYDIPKMKAQPPMGMAAPMGVGTGMDASGEGARSGLTWENPKGWIASPSSSGMRLASFRTSESGADVSIISLGAVAGDEASNVNRWRGQVSLGPLDAQAISDSAKKGKAKIGAYRWFQIRGPQQSIYIAIIRPGDQTIFVKMMGDEKELSKNEKAFLQLVNSISRQSGKSKSGY